MRNGPVTITPAVDGPLLVTSNLELGMGTGRTIERAAKLALYRCGHSANKPFCDGSHTRVGFRSGDADA